MRSLSATAASRSADWLAYFTDNRVNRMHIDWELGVHLTMDVQKPLIHSLQRFQVGEQGDGHHLKKQAARRGDPAYSAAIDLFVQEEQEHARLLAALLGALDADLLQSHWSDTAFMLLRHLSGLDLELLILLIAEIIAKRYYRALAEGIDDPVAHAVFAQIVRDEQGHVAFHCETVHDDFVSYPAIVRAAVRLTWHSVFRFVCLIVMADHNGVLRAVKVRSSAFWYDCNALFNEAADIIFSE